MNTKEELKSSLLQFKRDNNETWRSINCHIFMEQVTNLIGDREKAISKLRECAIHTKTIDRLCDRMMSELEKSTTDPTKVKICFEKIGCENSQLNLLFDEYKSLRKKKD